MIRAALVGTGTMGRNYLRFVNDGKVHGLIFTAAVARSESSRTLVKEIAGDTIALFQSEDELYEHADLFDAVIIATPHRFHPAMGERALRCGKHLMLDKPMGISVADCEVLLKAEQECDSVFTMMFHQRTYPSYRRIKELIDSGEIGTIRRVLMENTRYFRTAHYHHSGSWRSSWNGEGGGMLINQGQHLLDIYQWLFGMPETLSARIGFGKYNDFRVDDEAVLYTTYSGGASGLFILSTGEGTRQERLEISGSKGTAILTGNRLSIHRYNRDLTEYAETALVNAREELTETVTEEAFDFDETSQPRILENFVKAIEDNESLIVPGKEGIRALELSNAAYLSAWTKETVSLPIDAVRYQKLLEEHQKEEMKCGQQ